MQKKEHCFDGYTSTPEILILHFLLNLIALNGVELLVKLWLSHTHYSVSCVLIRIPNLILNYHVQQQYSQNLIRCKNLKHCLVLLQTNFNKLSVNSKRNLSLYYKQQAGGIENVVLQSIINTMSRLKDHKQRMKLWHTKPHLKPFAA